MRLLDRIPKDDMRGVHYAVSVFIATTILWVLVRKIGDQNPIWAVSSMIAASDPLFSQAVKTFYGRLANTLIGCVMGLGAVAIGHAAMELPITIGLTVLVTSYIVRVPTMWRQAPITAAIIIAGTLQHQDKVAAIEAGLLRVWEVILGCVVGVGVSWLLSKVWPLPAPKG